MLQRTKAEQVVSVYTIFVSRYTLPNDVLFEEPQEILKLLEPLGLRWRAKKIIELSNELVCKGNTIPKTFNALVALPGVGPYAASAFLSFHAEVRKPIVDANSVRLWMRVFGVKNESEMRRKKDFLRIVNRVTPLTEFKIFNYSVLDHTRAICKKKPLCEICPINDECNYYLSIKPA